MSVKSDFNASLTANVKADNDAVPKELVPQEETKKKKGPPTREEILEKLLYYKTHFAEFIETFGRIRSQGLKKFNLFDYQRELINNFQHERFNVVLKARQTGISRSEEHTSELQS